MTLQWLTLLCQNDEHWQEYLRKQDNSILNQNILLDVVELMRTSILRYRHEYVIDLLRALIKFMTASVNGKNETIVDLYVNTNVVKYCKEILTTGLYSNEIEFIKNISKNSSIERSEEMEKSLEPSINIRSSKKHNLLKEEVLWFLNCLLIQSTEDEVKMVDNYDVINSLMVLNYAQYKIYKGRDYDLELFKPDSKLSEAYNINVGFRCYHLISKLWGNNKLPQSN